ncbi:MAG: DNA methyltransferase, partial [Ignavibacteriae bacterium]
KINVIEYRPFDKRYIYFDEKLIGRAFYSTMKHFVQKDNTGIIFSKQFINSFKYVFISKNITDMNLISSAGKFGAGFTCPLYLYTDDGSKIPNLKKEIINEIEKIVGKVTPEDILDYIYAVLHSPSYREKYKEFLKIDFPRVPYPKNKRSFKKLVKLGTELRLLHLLELPKVNQFITTYPVTGSNIVEKINYNDGNVFINKDQYFGKVPKSAWEFYIGGYQPAQKWLKDRKKRTLTNRDIEHYQKIIVVLSETEKIMKEIDKIE